MKIVEMKNNNNEKVIPDFITDDLSNDSHVKVPSIYGINKLLENINATLLWENSSPYTLFTPQKISLDLTKYKYVIIEAYRYSSVNLITISTIAFLNQSIQIVYSDYDNSMVRTWNRDAEISNTGVLFDNSVINGGVDNYSLIPKRIWGFK